MVNVSEVDTMNFADFRYRDLQYIENNGKGTNLNVLLVVLDEFLKICIKHT